MRDKRCSVSSCRSVVFQCTYACVVVLIVKPREMHAHNPLSAQRLYAKSSAIWIRLYRKPDSDSNLPKPSYQPAAHPLRTVILTLQSFRLHARVAPLANSVRTSREHHLRSACSAKCTLEAPVPPAARTAHSGTVGCS